MNFLVTAIALSFCLTMFGQSERIRVAEKRFEYPIFLRPDNSDVLTTEIILYNAIDGSHNFDICYFDRKSGNYGSETFFIRKTTKSDEIDLVSTTDYLRIDVDTWREVTIGSSGPSQQILKVMPRIVVSDTVALYDPSTFDEIHYIFDYRLVE